MEVTIYQEPCWLLEAAELVYGLVNNIPTTKLAGNGPYCLPLEQVAQLLTRASGWIDPADELVQYYFHGVPLVGFTNRLSCLGCAVLYSSLPVDCSRPGDYAASIREAWHTLEEAGYCVDGIDGFSLNLVPSEGKPVSLAKELSALEVPELYKMQLLEVFTAFDFHAERLLQLLSPVADALSKQLASWMQPISALAREWETFFQHNSPQEFFLRQARIQNISVERLEIAFRILSPACAHGKHAEKDRQVRLHMGIGMKPSLDPPVSARAPDEWELSAIRLLANSARMEMLRLMMDRPMSGQELVQKLNLNSGSVFRDLNSLLNARLLLLEAKEGRNYYRTNMDAIRQITEHLVNHIQSGANS